MRPILAGALVAGLGAASWFIVQSAKHPARPQTHSNIVPDTAIAAPVRSTLSAHAAVTPRPKQPLAAPVPSTSSSPHASPPTSEQEAGYSALFTEDAPAVAESWKYENAIRGQLAKLPSTTATLESFDCHRRLCKASLLFDSVSSDVKTLKEVFLSGTTAEFPRGFGAIAAPTREYLPDGRVRTTLYLAREGEMVVASQDDEP